MSIKYTKELIEPLVKESTTWSQVCRKLNIKPATGSQSHLKKRAIDFGIDFKHFTGQSWNLGRKFGYKNDLKVYFDGTICINSHRLKQRLIESGIKENKCERCKRSKWLGEEIVLELDHINNNHDDNKLENLMILCPNCHARKTRNARVAKKKTHYA